MLKAHERLAVFIFGVVFITALLILSVAFPQPTFWQYQLFRIVLSLAAAGVAAMIPGSIEVSASKWVKAGGAIAVFVLVLYESPAQLVVAKPELMGQLEIGFDRHGSDFSPLPHLVGTPDECSTMCSANTQCKAMTFVARPEQFGGGDCWLKFIAPPKTPDKRMVSAKKAGVD